MSDTNQNPEIIETYRRTATECRLAMENQDLKRENNGLREELKNLADKLSAQRVYGNAADSETLKLHSKLNKWKKCAEGLKNRLVFEAARDGEQWAYVQTEEALQAFENLTKGEL